MTILIVLGSTWCTINLRFFLTLPILYKWSKPSIIQLCTLSSQIIVLSISWMSFVLNLITMVYSSNSLVLTPLSRIECRSKKPIILCLWFSVSYGGWEFINISGTWLPLLSLTLWIAYLLGYYKARHYSISFSLLVPYSLSSLVSSDVHVFFKSRDPHVLNLMIRMFFVSFSGIRRCSKGLGIMILSLVICITRWMPLFWKLFHSSQVLLFLQTLLWSYLWMRVLYLPAHFLYFSLIHHHPVALCSWLLLPTPHRSTLIVRTLRLLWQHLLLIQVSLIL